MIHSTMVINNNPSKIEIRGLKYGANGPIDMAIGESECIGVTGPSGCGKTLFLRSIADLDEHEGVVLLNGKDRMKFHPPLWRKNVMMLPAESQWWYDMVGEHFKSPHDERLALLGFDGDVMNWEVSRLSGGEKQRLALLRLLEQRPQVILLDEPTAHLDRLSSEIIEEMLQNDRVENGISMIWVGHDKDQLSRVSARLYSIEKSFLERMH